MADTRMCLHGPRLLRTRPCLLLPGPGILNQSCSEGMELVLMFPFPPSDPVLYLRALGKGCFLAQGARLLCRASQECLHRCEQCPTVTRGWEGTLVGWAMHWPCFLVKHTQPILPYSLAPDSPGVSSSPARPREPRLSPSVLAMGKAGHVGTAPAPGRETTQPSGLG